MNALQGEKLNYMQQQAYTCWIVSLFWEWDSLDVVVELEGHIDLDQADVVDDDAGIVILKRRPV